MSASAALKMSHASSSDRWGDEMERTIEALRLEIKTLERTVTKLETIAASLAEESKEARNQRAIFQSELRAYGIEMTKFSGKLETLASMVTKGEATLNLLNADRTMMLGAGKVAGVAWPIVQPVIWAIAGILAGALGVHLVKP